MKEYKMSEERVKNTTQKLTIYAALCILIVAFVLGKEDIMIGDYYGFTMFMLGEIIIAAFVLYFLYKNIVKKASNLKFIIEDDHFIWNGIDGKTSIVSFDDILKVREVSRGALIVTKSKGRLSIPSKLENFNDIILLLKEKTIK